MTNMRRLSQIALGHHTHKRGAAATWKMQPRSTELPLPRRKYEPTKAPAPPDSGVRASTFKLLLDTAMDVIQEDGHMAWSSPIYVEIKDEG